MKWKILISSPLQPKRDYENIHPSLCFGIRGLAVGEGQAFAPDLHELGEGDDLTDGESFTGHLAFN